MSTWTGLAHLIAFSVATTAVSLPLAFIQIAPARLVIAGVILVTLAYFAVADWLYMARLAGYVCIAEMPDALASPRHASSSAAWATVCAERPVETSIDRDEPILSDIPPGSLVGLVVDVASIVSTTSPLHGPSDLRNSSVEPQSRLNQSLLSQSIVILDFGAQYTQLIARRIREQNVFSVVLPCTASLDEVKSYAPVGIVLSGAPWSVYDKDAPPADPRIFELGLPVLGICYGLQFMVHTLGGKVRPADKREYGHAEIDIVAESVLFQRTGEAAGGVDVAWRRGAGIASRI